MTHIYAHMHVYCYIRNSTLNWNFSLTRSPIQPEISAEVQFGWKWTRLKKRENRVRFLAKIACFQCYWKCVEWSIWTGASCLFITHDGFEVHLLRNHLNIAVYTSGNAGVTVYTHCSSSKLIQCSPFANITHAWRLFEIMWDEMVYAAAGHNLKRWITTINSSMWMGCQANKCTHKTERQRMHTQKRHK